MLELKSEDQNVDPGLLLVKGKSGEDKSYIKTLSHAVITVLTKYGYANLRCVGAASVNNAIKAVTIASGEAKVNGLNLVISPSFQEVEFDGTKKTCVMLNVTNK